MAKLDSFTCSNLFLGKAKRVSEIDANAHTRDRNRVVLGFHPIGLALAGAISDALAQRDCIVDIVEGSGIADYPDIAVEACRQILHGGRHSAILVCGTGLGMSITANKIPGIRAARCTDTYSAEKARRNSAANVMALGSEVTTPSVAATLVSVWLEFDFDSERSRPKLYKIAQLEIAGIHGD